MLVTNCPRKTVLTSAEPIQLKGGGVLQRGSALFIRALVEDLTNIIIVCEGLFLVVPSDRNPPADEVFMTRDVRLTSTVCCHIVSRCCRFCVGLVQSSNKECWGLLKKKRQIYFLFEKSHKFVFFFKRKIPFLSVDNGGRKGLVQYKLKIIPQMIIFKKKILYRFRDHLYLLIISKKY